MAMLIRYCLALVLGIVLGALPAAAEPPIRVLDEQAYATQLRNGITSTVQVIRSTSSDGAVQTTLFFSAYDASGNLIGGGLFQTIDNALFLVDKERHTATLNHPDVKITWHTTGEYIEVSRRTEVKNVVDNRGFDFSSSFFRRLAETELLRSATAEGVAGGIAFNIQRQTIDETGYESAFVDIRKTRLLQKGPEGSDADSP